MTIIIKNHISHFSTTYSHNPHLKQVRITTKRYKKLQNENRFIQLQLNDSDQNKLNLTKYLIRNCIN